MSYGKEERKLVYISSRLLDRMLYIVRGRGTSLKKLVEDAVSYYLQIYELNYELEEATEVLKALKMMKAVGAVFTPRAVLECMEKQSCSPQERIKKWHEVGKAYGIYIREKCAEPAKTLRSLLRILRWDLEEVSVDRDGNAYRIRCASSAFTEEDTANLVEFIKGALEGLNMKIIGLEAVRGVIVVRFLSPQTTG